jgi:hypothetical protein
VYGQKIVVQQGKYAGFFINNAANSIPIRNQITGAICIYFVMTSRMIIIAQESEISSTSKKAIDYMCYYLLYIVIYY